MADLNWAGLEPQLPPDISPLHKTILWVLTRTSCVARRGAGPATRSSTRGSPDCRICFEALAGELTLRHDDATQVSGATAEPRALRPCNRTYHLACLIEWAANNVKDKRAVTCPGDRLELISANTVEAIYDAFDLGASSQHPIRDINSVIPFWEILNRRNPNPPPCEFDLGTMSASDILYCAAHGSDVGLISSEAVRQLPLGSRQRAEFDHYNSQTIQRPPRGRRLRTTRQRVYNTYVYIDMHTESTDSNGVRHAVFGLVPMKGNSGRVLCRYLLGMLGEVYSIWVDLRLRVHAIRCHLSDQEVIDLHAETETRRLIAAQRGLAISVYNYPRAITWYWPFPNGTGGIVAGGTLPDQWYPTRGYDLRGLNIGQTNDQRFAILANSPLSGATQRSNELVDDFIRARLPFEFPRGYGLYQDIDRTGNHHQFQQFVVPLPDYPIPLPRTTLFGPPTTQSQPVAQGQLQAALQLAPQTVPQPAPQSDPQLQPAQQNQWTFQGPIGFPGQQDSQFQLAAPQQPPSFFATRTHAGTHVPEPYGQAATFVNSTGSQAGGTLPLPQVPQLAQTADMPNPFRRFVVPQNTFSNDRQPAILQIINSSDDSDSGQQTSSSGRDRPVHSQSPSSSSGSRRRRRRRLNPASVSPLPAEGSHSDSDSVLDHGDAPHGMELDR